MESSIIIAQILGIVFVVLGMSLFTSKKATVSLVEEITKNGAMVWLFGFISLVMGSIIITFVNSWNSNIEIIITTLGYLMVLKGIALLILPDVVISIYKNSKTSAFLVWGGLIVFIIGAVLMFSV